jgi:membrane protein
VLLCEPSSTIAEPLIRTLLADRQPGLSALWEQAGWEQTTVGVLIGRTAPAALAEPAMILTPAASSTSTATAAR